MIKNTKEEVAHWDKVLDEYEHNMGLPHYSENCLPEDELQQYLTMSRDVLEKYTENTINIWIIFGAEIITSILMNGKNVR